MSETFNGHGALLTFVDDFDGWHWDDRDAVTDISAKAVRRFIKELSGDCRFVIYPSDEGGRIILSGLRCDIQIEADLGSVLRHFAMHDWDEAEQLAFRRLLGDILELPLP